MQLPIFPAQGKVSSLDLEKVEKTCRSGPPRPSFQTTPHLMTDNIRYADIDAQNHVNNIAIATFFESGRVGFSHDPVLGFSIPGAIIALRRIEIDYLAEMTFPGQVTIATRSSGSAPRRSPSTTHCLSATPAPPRPSR